MTVNRRQALRQTSLLLGLSLSGPALTGVLNGCTTEVVSDWQPRFLTGEEALLVSAASARILPSGETPGASDAGVSKFIDIMLAEYYEPADQQRFRTGLRTLESQSQSVLKKSYVDGTESDQDQMLRQQVDLARQQLKESPDSPRPFFLMLKELTLLGYFTSEVGATQFLNFDEIPGSFQGCAPLESVGGKTWAT